MKREHENAFALSRLAHARYPDMSLLLAIECFRSDRQRAGMGALGVKSRGWGGRRRREISRVKHDYSDGKVQYVLAVNRPERHACPVRSVDDFTLGHPVEATMTLVLIPAKEVAIGVVCHARDLFDQGMRSHIARELREARRRLESAR
ncbi:hypothetical protein [Variovorax boronicumulans]|uniref:hypothetical protein n=1 Tax=Variovorax boronicumulans TaxID=436515 RepID=UPI0012E6D87C|nr:hypothetical protein [Variovorax boronicumulans]GER16703.1 hypothetical protein VCH24_17100 [Variovorax boronicumulans]